MIPVSKIGKIDCPLSSVIFNISTMGPTKSTAPTKFPPKMKRRQFIASAIGDIAPAADGDVPIFKIHLSLSLAYSIFFARKKKFKAVGFKRPAGRCVFGGPNPTIGNKDVLCVQTC